MLIITDLKQSGLKYSSFAKSVNVKQQMNAAYSKTKHTLRNYSTFTSTNSAALTQTD